MTEEGDDPDRPGPETLAACEKVISASTRSEAADAVYDYLGQGYVAATRVLGMLSVLLTLAERGVREVTGSVVAEDEPIVGGVMASSQCANDSVAAALLNATLSRDNDQEDAALGRIYALDPAGAVDVIVHMAEYAGVLSQGTIEREVVTTSPVEDLLAELGLQ